MKKNPINPWAFLVIVLASLTPVANATEGVEASISGFMDAMYLSQKQSGVINVSSDKGLRGFMFGQAEVDCTFKYGNGLTGRIDVSDGAGSDAKGGDLAIVGLPVGGGGAESIVEQMRIDFSPNNNLTITLGKWDTFIGLEPLEPTDSYTMSLGLTKELEPTEQLGASVKYKRDFFVIEGALVDSLSNVSFDFNKKLTTQFHFGVTPIDNLELNLYYGTGGEGTDGIQEEALIGTTSYLTDVSLQNDITLQSFNIEYRMGSWYFGLEHINVKRDQGIITTYYGPFPTTKTSATSEDTAWEAMANYSFSDPLSLTFRYGVNKADERDPTSRMSGNIRNLTVATIIKFLPSFPQWESKIEYASQKGDAKYPTSDEHPSGIATSGAAKATIYAIETTLKF